MLETAIARKRPGAERRPLFGHPGCILTTLLAIGLLWPGQGFCDLYIEFLVDQSGSMWAPYQGDPKFVHVANAIETVTQKLPTDVAMGLRVYPPAEKEARGKDPGLRIQVEKENRARFSEEKTLLNPQGKGSLGEQLKRALKDFPDGQDTKLLVVLCDGADTEGASFCERALDLDRPKGLRFYAISLNLIDPSEKEALDCLSKQMDGESIHLTGRNDLVSTLLPIAQSAHQDEVERQRRVAEEQRRISESLSKTRLKVEIHNTLDPFFADTIQVDQCSLNGEEILLDTSVRLKQGEGFLLFDRATGEGTHQLTLRYQKWEDEKAVSSVEGILEVQLEEGKTSHVQCFPRGALFHWDFTFKTQTF